MPRPNIVVFLTDDHGQWASNAYGNSELNTPTMDWMADTGARFDNAFTPSPVCSPARACFWTGKIPSAHGIHDHIGNRDHPGVTGQETLAEALQAAGYRTGLCGKWHCHAHGDIPRPGFDFWFSQWGGTNARFGPQPFSRNGDREDHHGHQGPIITDAAIDFLRSDATVNQPFFLFVGYTETHSPFATLPERLAASARKRPLEGVSREPFSEVHGKANTPAPGDAATWREQLAQYYAAVEIIDAEVGRVIDALEGLGQLDDTLIIYTADHGHMNGQHGLLCKGNATTPQNFLDESIRVPLLVRWPEQVVAGQRLAAFADHCDTHETLRAAAGISAQQCPGGPGRSFLQHLGESGGLEPWRTAQVCEYGNARMIRTDDGYKLVRRFPGPNGHFPDAFFALTEDPRETRNVITDPRYQEIIAGLDARLNGHFAAHSDPRRSGTNLDHLPIHNRDEPWRRRLPPE